MVLALGTASFVPARAQPQRKPFKVGFLANHIPLRDLQAGNSASFSGPTSAAIFVHGMRERGWIDGNNVAFIWRSAEGDFDRHPGLARELVAEAVDVIVAFDEGVSAAAQATTGVPIVMGGFSHDPVKAGLAKSLARPGGNVTGMTHYAGAELGKALSLMKETLPRMKRLAFILYAAGRAGDALSPGPLPGSTIAGIAERLNLEIFYVPFGHATGVPAALASAARRGADAFWFEPNYALYGSREHGRRAIEETIRQRVLAMHMVLPAAEKGAVMAYGSDFSAVYEKIALYVDRILRGAKPGDLPIEQPSKVEFHVNMQAARAIGLEIPPAVLLQADRVFR